MQYPFNPPERYDEWERLHESGEIKPACDFCAGDCSKLMGAKCMFFEVDLTPYIYNGEFLYIRADKCNEMTFQMWNKIRELM